MSKEGWVIVHPSGHVELDYFNALEFNDKGRPVSRFEWKRLYRPNCEMVRGTVVYHLPPLEGDHHG